MGKNNQLKYQVNPIQHKKLIKSKKLWKVVGVSTIAFGAYAFGQSPLVHADTNNNVPTTSSSSDTNAASVYQDASSVYNQVPSSQQTDTSSTQTQQNTPQSVYASSSSTPQVQSSVQTQTPIQSSNVDSSTPVQTSNQTSDTTNVSNVPQSTNQVATQSSTYQSTVESSTPTTQVTSQSVQSNVSNVPESSVSVDNRIAEQMTVQSSVLSSVTTSAISSSTPVTTSTASTNSNSSYSPEVNSALDSQTAQSVQTSSTIKSATSLSASSLSTSDTPVITAKSSDAILSATNATPSAEDGNNGTSSSNDTSVESSGTSSVSTSNSNLSTSVNPYDIQISLSNLLMKSVFADDADTTSLYRAGDDSDQDISNRDSDATLVYNQNGIQKYSDGSVALDKDQMKNTFSLYGDATSVDNGTILTPVAAQGTSTHGMAQFNSAISLSQPYTMTAALKWGTGDGIGMLFYPASQGKGLIGGTGGDIGINGIPNVYGFKIDTYPNSDDDASLSKQGLGYLGFQYATFQDTDSNGHEILDSKGLDPYYSSSQTSGPITGTSGQVTFSYTPNAQVSGDTQTGTLSVSFPVDSSVTGSNVSNGVMTISHQISYSKNNPAYYFSVSASNDVAQASQEFDYHLIKYYPAQEATVNLIDSTTNQTIATNTFSGRIGQAIDPSGGVASQIQSYEAKNYTVVSNDLTSNVNTAATAVDSSGNVTARSNLSLDGTTPFSDNQLHFSTDINTINPVYTIKLGHALQVNDADGHTVTRTINYVDGDENNAAITNAPSVTQTATIHHYAVIDKVTGQTIGYSLDGSTNVSTKDPNAAWVITPTSFPAITSPDLSSYGYTAPDTTSIPALTITSSTQSTTPVTITYHHAKQSVSASTAQTPGQKINQNGDAVWPAGTDAASLQANSQRTISYVDSVTGKTLSPSVTQSVQFNRTAVVDKVTGKLLGYSSDGSTNVNTTTGYDGWDADSKTLPALKSPQFVNQGYQYAQSDVDAFEVSPAQNFNLNTVIHYDHRLVRVEATDNVTPGSVIDSSNPNQIKYPSGVSNSDLAETTTRTLQYVDAQTGQKIHPDTVQNVHYYRTALVDAVTGQLMGYGLNHDYTVDVTTANANNAWQTDDPTFKATNNPDLSALGYANPTDQVFDLKSTLGNNVTQVIHYPHALIDVDANENKMVGAIIDPANPNQVVYPTGVDVNSLSRNAVRQIHYVDYASGQSVSPMVTQSVPVNRTAVVDKVTGKLLGYDMSHHDAVDTTDGDKAWYTTEPDTQWTYAVSPDLRLADYTDPDIKTVAATPVDPNQALTSVYVKYGHQITFVTSPQIPGTVINPNNPNQVKWPAGTDDITRNITRTIQLVDSQTGQTIDYPVTQTVTYHRIPVVDKVTGQIIGYSLNNTGRIDLSNNDAANAWQTSDKYWDTYDAPSLKALGYDDPTTNQTIAKQLVGLNDSNQTISIPYPHHLNVLDPDSQVMTRTIQYVDDVTGQKLAPDTVQSITFYRYPIKDMVSGKIIGYSKNHQPITFTTDANAAWVPMESFADVNAHQIAGYSRPDRDNVDALVVSTPQGNMVVAIKYHRLAQSATSVVPKPAKPSVSSSSTISSSVSSSNVSSQVSSMPTSVQVAASSATSTATNDTTNSSTDESLSDAPNADNLQSNQMHLSFAPRHYHSEPKRDVNSPQQLTQSNGNISYPKSSSMVLPLAQQNNASNINSNSVVNSETTSNINNASSQPLNNNNNATQTQTQQAQLPQTGDSDTAEVMGAIMLLFASLMLAGVQLRKHE